MYIQCVSALKTRLTYIQQKMSYLSITDIITRAVQNIIFVAYLDLIVRQTIYLYSTEHTVERRPNTNNRSLTKIRKFAVTTSQQDCHYSEQPSQQQSVLYHASITTSLELIKTKSNLFVKMFRISEFSRLIKMQFLCSC